MALGFCKKCDCLKSIRTSSQKWGSRECQWRPVQHDRTTHLVGEEECPSVTEANDLVEYGHVCRKCGPVPAASVLLVPCDGHRYDI